MTELLEKDSSPSEEQEFELELNLLLIAMLGAVYSDGPRSLAKCPKPGWGVNVDKRDILWNGKRYVFGGSVRKGNVVGMNLTIKPEFGPGDYETYWIPYQWGDSVKINIRAVKTK